MTNPPLDFGIRPETSYKNTCVPQINKWKLWLYTNYDCHLHCSYCVAKSSPNAPRRALGLKNVHRLVDEAIELDFSEIFFTGGEPFILRDIYDMLDYASRRIKTTVLTTGILIKGKRLDQLNTIHRGNLTLQVSLDGARPEQHDVYRGQGTWMQAVEAIHRLLNHGYHVKLSTTETPANSKHLNEICELHRSWGIPDEDHFVRPLARRGYSKEGLELEMTNVSPEVTVNLDGVFWHPLSTDADMQISKTIFPLSTAFERIQEQLEVLSAGGVPMMAFT